MFFYLATKAGPVKGIEAEKSLMFYFLRLKKKEDITTIPAKKIHVTKKIR